MEKPPQKPAARVKVNFLSDEDKTISEIPIFVTRAPKRPKKNPTPKIKKESNGS